GRPNKITIKKYIEEITIKRGLLIQDHPRRRTWLAPASLVLVFLLRYFGLVRGATPARFHWVKTQRAINLNLITVCQHIIARLLHPKYATRRIMPLLFLVLVKAAAYQSHFNGRALWQTDRLAPKAFCLQGKNDFHRDFGLTSGFVHVNNPCIGYSCQ